MIRLLVQLVSAQRCTLQVKRNHPINGANPIDRQATEWHKLNARQFSGKSLELTGIVIIGLLNP